MGNEERQVFIGIHTRSRLGLWIRVAKPEQALVKAADDGQKNSLFASPIALLLAIVSQTGMRNV